MHLDNQYVNRRYCMFACFALKKYVLFLKPPQFHLRVVFNVILAALMSKNVNAMAPPMVLYLWQLQAP